MPKPFISTKLYVMDFYFTVSWRQHENVNNPPLLKKPWPDVVKHLMIDFDWPVRNRREDSQLPPDLYY